MKVCYFASTVILFVDYLYSIFFRGEIHMKVILFVLNFFRLRLDSRNKYRKSINNKYDIYLYEVHILISSDLN